MTGLSATSGPSIATGFSPPSSYSRKSQNQPISQWPSTSAGPSQIPSRLADGDLSDIRPSTGPMGLLPGAQEDKKDGPGDISAHLLSRGSTVSSIDEEAIVYNSTRMLQDPTGRLRKSSKVLSLPALSSCLANQFLSLYRRFSHIILFAAYSNDRRQCCRPLLFYTGSRKAQNRREYHLITSQYQAHASFA
jgi:hypothetical protein